MSERNVSVLVPLYNEEVTILEILEKVVKLPFVKEVVVVDDGSKDNSFQVVAEFAKESELVKLFKMEKNSGKTAAINRALKEATGDIVVIQDADLEYDPEELKDVLWPILADKADVVYGSRFMTKKASRVLYFYHYLANKFLTFLSNFLTNINMTDIETCYKAFRGPILKDYELTSKGFGMEVELTAMIAKMNLRIFEVPISYYGRTYEEGKKIGMRDGILAIYYILYYNLYYFKWAKGRNHIRKSAR